MTEIQAEWYYFILPLVTVPTLVLWTAFLKHVVPKWFSSLEDK